MSKTLKNGGHVSELHTSKIMSGIRTLHTQDEDGQEAVSDLFELCHRRKPFVVGRSKELLKFHNLLPHKGEVTQAVRDVVLSALSRRNGEIVVESPYVAAGATSHRPAPHVSYVPTSSYMDAVPN